MLRIIFFLLTVISLDLCLRVHAQDPPLQRSENGWHLSPHGTIRILVVFAEIEYDQSREKDPQPDGAEHWPKGQLPVEVLP
jgi:hypothetical protein